MRDGDHTCLIYAEIQSLIMSHRIIISGLFIPSPPNKIIWSVWKKIDGKSMKTLTTQSFFYIARCQCGTL